MTTNKQSSGKPSLAEIAHISGGNPERQAELMRTHGYVVRVEPGDQERAELIAEIDDMGHFCDFDPDSMTTADLVGFKRATADYISTLRARRSSGDPQ